MVTIKQLKEMASEACNTQPLPGPEWPPSIYYRYLGIVARNISCRNFVELGTDGGGAARSVAMMSPGTNVITIDIRKAPTVDMINLPNFKFVQGDSVALAETIGPTIDQELDLLFIDTVHEYDHAMAETNAWVKYMPVGAVICYDDLYRPGLERLWNDLPFQKTGYRDLHVLHIGGVPTDGGFGVAIK